MTDDTVTACLSDPEATVADGWCNHPGFRHRYGTPPTVKPSLEQVVDVLAAQPPGRGEWTSSRIMQTARAVLALLPGRTETEVKAEALRDAAQDARLCWTGTTNLRDQDDPEKAYSFDAWLDVRADHIEKEADRG